MPAVNTWKKLQAASGLFFGTFLVMHLVSHFNLSLGMDKANETLRNLRQIYQNPLYEAALLVSLLTHMASNTIVILHRQKIQARMKKDGKTLQTDSPEHTAHRYAGYFLGVSVLGHAGATRLAPLLFLEDASQYDYSFVAKVQHDLIPFNAFAVYLVLFGVAGGWHLIYGARSALATLQGTSVVGTTFPMSLKFLAMSSHLSILSAVLAVSGAYYVVDLETKAELHDIVNKKLGL